MRIWITEIDVIKDVKEVRYEPQLPSLSPERDGLGNGQIPVLESRSINIAGSGSAYSADCRFAETTGVEPLGSRVRVVHRLAGTKEVRRLLIRPGRKEIGGRRN